MRALLAIFLAGALSFLQAPVHAQDRYYNQAELDALLAPIALYPDPLLSQVLMAATYPADVHEAAAWSRANPQLKGEDAVRAAQGAPWDPSVKSLLAFPEVLARMDESPQWLADLGQAFLAQQPQVMDTVQELRRRAQASGYVPAQNLMQQEGSYIAIYPAQQYVYVAYYDPLLVYGPWWWPAYRPVYWRPWRPAPVFVSATFFFGTMDWHRHYVTVVRRPVFVQPNQVYVYPGRWRHAEHRAVAHAAPAYVARPVAPAVRAQPRAERREYRRDWRSDPRPQPSFQQQSAPVHSNVQQASVRTTAPAVRVQSDVERHSRNHERPAAVTRPVAPAVRVQPGFQRRETRQERRAQGKRWDRRPG